MHFLKAGFSHSSKEKLENMTCIHPEGSGHKSFSSKCGSLQLENVYLMFLMIISVHCAALMLWKVSLPEGIAS